MTDLCGIQPANSNGDWGSIFGRYMPQKSIGRRSFVKMAGLSKLGVTTLYPSGREKSQLLDNRSSQSDSVHTVDPSNGEKLRHALNNASADDTIVVSGGTEEISTGLEIPHKENITVKVAEDAVFTLDASNYKPDNPRRAGPAIAVERADGFTLDGTAGQFIIEGPDAMGINVRYSSDFTIRGLIVRNCALSGIVCGAGAKNGRFEWCLSYGNNGMRIQEGGNSDGFHFGAGKEPSKSEWPSNISLYCCLSHQNSDDGFDMIRAHHVSLNKCITYWNGYTLKGDTTNAPGTGFKLGYARENYDSFDRTPPSENVVKNGIAWGNGSAGLMWGGGSGHKAINCTLWNNERKLDFGGNNGDDIDLWNPEGGLLKNILASQLGNTSGVRKENVWIKPVSEWGIDTMTGPGAPRHPSTFVVPESRSEIAQRAVGAVSPDADWPKSVLRLNYQDRY